jgi:hypothetical protein
MIWVMEVTDKSLQAKIDKGSYWLIVVLTSFLNFILTYSQTLRNHVENSLCTIGWFLLQSYDFNLILEKM